MKPVKKKHQYLLCLLIISIGVFFFFKLLFNSYFTDLNDLETYTVDKVVDGDTIKLNNGVTVRLIGIDAPESVHPDNSKNVPAGTISSEFLRDFIEGKDIQIEYDQERTDKYGRTLAYAYYNGVLIEETILSKGMAKTMFIEPNTRYKNKLRQVEQEAKDNKIGIWK